jgi:hypothetical protein
LLQSFPHGRSPIIRNDFNVIVEVSLRHFLIIASPAVTLFPGSLLNLDKSSAALDQCSSLIAIHWIRVHDRLKFSAQL